MGTDRDLGGIGRVGWGALPGSPYHEVWCRFCLRRADLPVWPGFCPFFDVSYQGHEMGGTWRGLSGRKVPIAMHTRFLNFGFTYGVKWYKCISTVFIIYFFRSAKFLNKHTNRYMLLSFTCIPTMFFIFTVHSQSYVHTRENFYRFVFLQNEK